MRLGVAGFSHETVSFWPGVTGLEAFERTALYGADIIEKGRGTNSTGSPEPHTDPPHHLDVMDKREGKTRIGAQTSVATKRVPSTEDSNNSHLAYHLHE